MLDLIWSSFFWRCAAEINDISRVFGCCLWKQHSICISNWQL